MKYKVIINDDTGEISITIPNSELKRIGGETDSSYNERVSNIANKIYLEIDNALYLRALKKHLIKMQESNIYGVMINESNVITRNINKHNYSDFIRKRHNKTR